MMGWGYASNMTIEVQVEPICPITTSHSGAN
jgi:hypothetical protein